MKKSKIVFAIPLILMCCSFSPYAFGNVRITLAAMFHPSGDISLIERMSGQAFLIIKNDYSWPLDMGYFDLGPFETVSVGLYMPTIHGNTTLKKGIYYNREAYNLTHNIITTQLRGITTEISVGTFDTKIKDSNGRHKFEVYNDSYDSNTFDSAIFALEIYNSLTDSTILSDYDTPHPNEVYNALLNISSETNQQVINLMSYKENFFNFNVSTNEKQFFDTDGE